jgi:transcriptional regulator with XRE-family HTH domain
MNRRRIDTRIRALRLTRSQIAILTGIARPDISNYLNGTGNLPPARVERIVEVLNALEYGMATLTEEFPGLPIDLKNVDFLQRVIHAVSRDKAAIEQECQRLRQQTAEFVEQAEIGLAQSLSS